LFSPRPVDVSAFMEEASSASGWIGMEDRVEQRRDEQTVAGVGGYRDKQGG
jgi:hypothetical protein